MSNYEMMETERISTSVAIPQRSEVDIPNAAPVRLQTLDLARHVGVAPDGRRYVVATYNDTHLHRDYITAIYPQQNGYLTLVRLMVCEFSSETPEEAVQLHILTVQAIQQGKLRDFIKSHQ
jgi:hypothetical protein